MVVNRALTRASFSTELQLPLNSRPDWGLDESSGDWLAELQSMRGRVLYDGGRRTKFLRPDGTCADLDPLDAVSYHVIVRSGGRIVGCARVTPLVPGVHGVVQSTVGDDHFRRLLDDIGETPQSTSEASRWMVAPEFRGHGLGFHIVAASWAVGRWLGGRVCLAAAGSRDNQDRMLMKLGGRPVDTIPLIPSEEFDDELHVLHFDLQQPSDMMVRWVDHMTTALGLDCLLDEAFSQRGA
jgi:hypothetical protein